MHSSCLVTPHKHNPEVQHAASIAGLGPGQRCTSNQLVRNQIHNPEAQLACSFAGLGPRMHLRSAEIGFTCSLSCMSCSLSRKTAAVRSPMTSGLLSLSQCCTPRVCTGAHDKVLYCLLQSNPALQNKVSHSAAPRPRPVAVSTHTKVIEHRQGRCRHAQHPNMYSIIIVSPYCPVPDVSSVRPTLDLTSIYQHQSIHMHGPPAAGQPGAATLPFPSYNRVVVPPAYMQVGEDCLVYVSAEAYVQ